MKKIYRNITLIGVLMLVLCLGGMCLISMQRDEWIVGERWFFYRFNANSILEDMKAEENDVFFPINQDEFPENRVELDERWLLQDYFNVVYELEKRELPSSFRINSINRINFELSCEDIYASPEIHISYSMDFKVEKENYVEFYFITLIPEYEFARVVERIHGHRKGDRTPIDLSDVKIPYEKVLEIVEKNGGKEFRETRNNQCSIDIYLEPSKKYGAVWEIRYIIWHTFDERHKFFVNASTGELISDELSIPESEE